MNIFNYFFGYSVYGIVDFLLSFSAFILLIIGASLRRRNIIPIIGSSILILVDTIGIAMKFYELFAAIRLITPIALLIISIVAFAKRKSRLNKFLGVLPFLIYLITTMLCLIIPILIYNASFGIISLASTIISLIFVGGLYLLIGLLLVKNPPATAKNVAYQYTAPATPVQNAYNPQANNYYAEPAQPVPPTQSIADEIIKLKSLMDQGIITPEEFEVKKKELLNI